jgi:hypothetical protein
VVEVPHHRQRTVCCQGPVSVQQRYQINDVEWIVQRYGIMHAVLTAACTVRQQCNSTRMPTRVKYAREQAPPRKCHVQR